MRCPVRLLLPLLLVLSASPAGAKDGEAGGLRAKARRLIEAAAAKDPAAWANALRSESGDLWLIAEALLVDGHGAVAARLAGARRGPDWARLAGYVAGRAQREGDKAALGAVLEARRLVLQQAWTEASARVAGPGKLDTVTGVYRAFIAANALVGRHLEAQAGERFEEAGKAAAGIGWQAMAGRSLLKAGQAAFRSNAFDRARTLLVRAAEVEVERAFPAGESAARRLLGAVYAALARYDEALSAYARAARLGAETGAPDLVAEALDGTGQVHEQRGDFQAALRFKRKALDLAERSGERTAIQRMRGNVGVTLASLGRYVEALPYARSARELAEAIGDPRTKASAYANLGRVQQRLGAMAESRRHLERARRIAREIGDERIEAAVLVNLGTAFRLTEEFERAVEIYDRAVELAERQRDAGRHADALQNLAAAHAGMGRSDLAREGYERVRALRRSLGDETRARRVEILLVNEIIGEAISAESAGDKAGARAKYDQARARLEQLVSAYEQGGDGRALPAARVNLALVLRRTGDVASARALLEKALAGARAARERRNVLLVLKEYAFLEYAVGAWQAAARRAREAVDVLSHLWRGNPEDYAARVREEQRSIFALGEDAALRARDTELAWWFLEHGRAGALLDQLRAREAIWNAVVPRSLRREEAEARDRLTAAVDAYGKVDGDTEFRKARSVRQQLDKAEEALDGVLERIQIEARAGAALVLPSPVPIGRLQGLLEPGDAFVAYSQFAHRLRAYVITRTGARHVALSSAERIGAAVKKARCNDSDFDPTKGLAELGRLVVDPLGLEAGVVRVLLSPSGVLTYVPFSALLPNHRLVYAPNGSTLDLLRATAPRDRGKGVLALGAPVYPRAGAHRRLRELPHSEAEVRAVGTEILLGKDATEARLRGALATSTHWRSVHLAVHGLVDAERPMWSSLALTPGDGDDGFLRPVDLLRVRVPADLVVLSACDTGRGRVYRAEGIVGLTRAFMYAGAPRVLCSLWRVGDKSTGALMKKFYELWNGEAGLSAAAALQQAQGWTRKQPGWRHERHWAAWVLWGLP